MTGIFSGGRKAGKFWGKLIIMVVVVVLVVVE